MNLSRRSSISIAEGFSRPSDRWRAVALHAAVIALALAGWATTMRQQQLQWLRLAPDAVERYVADAVETPWPRLADIGELQAVCAAPRGLAARLSATQWRAELARCLADPAAQARGAAAVEAASRYRATIAAQLLAAQTWLAAYEAQAPRIRASLETELGGIQARMRTQPAALALIGRWISPMSSEEPRTAVGPVDSPGAVARRLRERVAATRAQWAALDARGLPDALPGLALLATGRHLQPGTPPHLVVARTSLADALERQRRAHGYQARGFRLQALAELPGALACSAAGLLLVVQLAMRASFPATVGWALASWLTGLGAVLLTDLALTGDPALRYLAERQFIRPGIGDWTGSLIGILPWLASSARPPTLWWPLLIVAASVVVAAQWHRAAAWVGSGAERWRGRMPLATPFIVALTSFAVIAGPAAASECLILIACCGAAAHLAGNAPRANADQGLRYGASLPAGAGFAVAIGGALWRGDLGHALVVVVLGHAFLFLFGGKGLRRVVAVEAIVWVAALAASLVLGDTPSPLRTLAQQLPAHAQDRLRAMFDPLHAESSDIARVRWLMDSAGPTGWGIGYVPWQGLAAGHAQDGLPLQGPSDYVLTLASSVWGPAVGMAVASSALGVFVLAAIVGLRRSLAPALPPSARGLPALGGFGCLAMAIKIVLTVGGVAAVLPLTGLPLPLLGYGPASLAAALAYLSLALGPSVRTESLRWRALTGAVRRRGKVLACTSTATVMGILAIAGVHLAARFDGSGAPHVASERLRLARLAAAPESRVRVADFATANPWSALPGCLGAAPGACGSDGTPLLTDAWLRHEVGPRLAVALARPSGTGVVNHHEVPVGPTLRLTLETGAQPLAQRIADCYAGTVRGAGCASVLPRDAARRAAFMAADGLRAGALGIALIEVDSGRIAALSGAISDCTLAQIDQEAAHDAVGRTPALREGRRCAQLPDRRSAWVAGRHPALWMVPPGSSLKPFALIAAIDAGIVGPGREVDARWKQLLAESRERLPVQRVALASGAHYLDALRHVGPAGSTTDLLWGAPGDDGTSAADPVRWPHEVLAGAAVLRPTAMALDTSEEIRGLKQAGVDVDRRFGHAVMTEFVAARRLADASIGGGDLRIDTLGLADAWASIDRRARGFDRRFAAHLLERPLEPPARRSLDWLSRVAAQRTLAATQGVTSSRWRGTAQGACRVVFGGCPVDGLPSVSGKTGSADFLTSEGGPWAKPGQQWPTKLYGGVFTGGDGRRYAVGAMALRVRAGATHTLELDASAAAEAAFTLMRELGAP